MKASKNKIGLFFTHWSTEWSVDFPAVAKRIAGLGFDAMEISLAEFHGLPASQKAELRRVADDRGLLITCLIGLGPKYDMASSDRAVRDRAVDYVKGLLDDCRLLGSPVFGGLNDCAWPSSPPEGVTDKSPYVEWAVESVRRVMPVAEEHGIVFAIEVGNRFEQWLVNDAREGIAFCDAVGSPYCQVHLDTFHMNIEEDSFHDAILSCKGRLGHFHLGEPNRKHPGEGRMPWDEIFGALREIDYDGPIVMEPFVRPGGTVGRNVAVWRDLSNGANDEEMDEHARKALAFVRSKVG